MNKRTNFELNKKSDKIKFATPAIQVNGITHTVPCESAHMVSPGSLSREISVGHQ